MNDRLLTVEDLSARWQVTREFLNNLRSKGDGPKWVDISKKSASRATVRYQLAEVENYERTRLVSISSKERLKRKFPVQVKNRKPGKNTLKLPF